MTNELYKLEVQLSNLTSIAIEQDKRIKNMHRDALINEVSIRDITINQKDNKIVYNCGVYNTNTHQLYTITLEKDIKQSIKKLHTISHINASCTCPDFEERCKEWGIPCKHLYAVLFSIKTRKHKNIIEVNKFKNLLNLYDKVTNQLKINNKTKLKHLQLQKNHILKTIKYTSSIKTIEMCKNTLKEINKKLLYYNKEAGELL